RNIQWLISRLQAVTMITNHTFSNLVLHAPGLQSYGTPVDDQAMRALAARMASENGYTDQAGYELYDTSGTTEDWSYNTTGGYGYTFEIGLDGFHPPYESAVIAHYTGTTPEAGDGGGNRAAYLHALRSTVSRKHHSVIRGEAPPRAFLTLKKRFMTPTSPVIDGAGEEGDVVRFRETLTTTMRARRSGRFVWHVNPSTRPLVDPRRDLPKPRKGQPSDPVEFSGTPATTVPCADFDTTDETCWNDHPFTVPGGSGIDNGKATVSITWPEPASDWDLKVFRDSNGDESSAGESELVGSSGSAPTSSESTTITRPGLRPGPYVVRVINYAAVSPYEGRVTFAKTESSTITQKRERWKLVCRASKNGPVLARKKILVKRGQRARVDLSTACAS
ncbi:MAG TPA: M14 family zinc carboxypeptidase, partial [Dehalococcoidia bacterium]|nr:M14 family zinc carboxypeptidase [Dehalococcoidia bacterium]